MRNKEPNSDGKGNSDGDSAYFENTGERWE